MTAAEYLQLVDQVTTGKRTSPVTDDELRKADIWAKAAIAAALIETRQETTDGE